MTEKSLLAADGVGWASLVLMGLTLVSSFIDWGIAKSVLWSGLRAFLQLTLLGVLLRFIFARNEILWTGGAILAMTLAATQAITERLDSRYRRIRLHCLTSMAIGSWLSCAFAAKFILSPESAHSTAAVLPLAGLLLGNSLSGISLGMNQWVRDLQQKKDWIELYLAHGATRFEASKPLVQQVIRTALTPVLNAMTVAGVVSMPGMMTGQILAGADPTQAVRYQISILFLMAASTFLGISVAVSLGYFTVFTTKHQLNIDAIQRPAK